MQHCWPQRTQHCWHNTNNRLTLLLSSFFLGMLLKDKAISFFSLFRFCITMFPVPITLFKKKTKKKTTVISENVALKFCCFVLCFYLITLYWSFLGSWYFHSLQSSRSHRGDQTTILIDLLTTSNPLTPVPLSPGTSCWSWQSACWGEPPPWWRYRPHTGRSRCSRWTYGRTLAPLRSLQRARISTRKEFWSSPPLCKEPERNDEWDSAGQ